MDIPWEEVRLFLAIAESGSLSEASRILQIGQPTASRRLASLEESLGQRLFVRTARGVSLTALGERLLVPARNMANWAGEVGRAAESRDGRLSGVVRITAAPYVAFNFLAPFAAWLHGTHPQVQIDVLSSIHHLDLTRGEADLAIRGRKPTSDDLLVVAHFRVAQAVYASRSLAARLPAKPQAHELPWIAWGAPYLELPPNPQLMALVPDFRPVFTADNFLIQLQAACCGLGVVVLNRVRFPDMPTDDLVELDFDLGPHRVADVYLVAARSALAIPRVRLVVDLLTEMAHKSIANGDAGGRTHHV